MLADDDVLQWFQQLRGYRRIDFMSALLNECLPFELRFFGNYIEDLAKQHFNAFRDNEKRANNRTIVSNLTDLTKSQIRCQLIIYLALLYSSNSECSKELHMIILCNMGRLLNGHPVDGCEDESVIDETLLLLTMIIHHPAFTFHQKQVVQEMQLKLIQQLLKNECTQHQRPTKDRSKATTTLHGGEMSSPGYCSVLCHDSSSDECGATVVTTTAVASTSYSAIVASGQKHFTDAGSSIPKGKPRQSHSLRTVTPKQSLKTASAVTSGLTVNVATQCRPTEKLKSVSPCKKQQAVDDPVARNVTSTISVTTQQSRLSTSVPCSQHHVTYPSVISSNDILPASSNDSVKDTNLQEPHDSDDIYGNPPGKVSNSISAPDLYGHNLPYTKPTFQQMTYTHGNTDTMRPSFSSTRVIASVSTQSTSPRHYGASWAPVGDMLQMSVMDLLHKLQLQDYTDQFKDHTMAMMMALKEEDLLKLHMPEHLMFRLVNYLSLLRTNVSRNINGVRMAGVPHSGGISSRHGPRIIPPWTPGVPIRHPVPKQTFQGYQGRDFEVQAAEFPIISTASSSLDGDSEVKEIVSTDISPHNDQLLLEPNPAVSKETPLLKSAFPKLSPKHPSVDDGRKTVDGFSYREAVGSGSLPSGISVDNYTTTSYISDNTTQTSSVCISPASPLHNPPPFPTDSLNVCDEPTILQHVLASGNSHDTTPVQTTARTRQSHESTAHVQLGPTVSTVMIPTTQTLNSHANQHSAKQPTKLHQQQQQKQIPPQNYYPIGAPEYTVAPQTFYHHGNTVCCQLCVGSNGKCMMCTCHYVHYTYPIQQQQQQQQPMTTTYLEYSPPPVTQYIQHIPNGLLLPPATGHHQPHYHASINPYNSKALPNNMIYLDNIYLVSTPANYTHIGAFNMPPYITHKHCPGKKKAVLSCYNCGTAGHQASDCEEPTMESSSNHNQFRLKYSNTDTTMDPNDSTGTDQYHLQ